jgi:hypothetical protein
MAQLHGGCHCGGLELGIELPRPAQTYAPRACDCDFCRKHAAAYVSDPYGSLLVRVRDTAAEGRYRQGSGSAEMLLCRNCGVLLGALYRHENALLGVANVRTLESRGEFAPEQTVSPRLLSAEQKVGRWREIWFPNVNIISAARC